MLSGIIFSFLEDYIQELLNESKGSFVFSGNRILSASFRTLMCVFFISFPPLGLLVLCIRKLTT